MVYLLRFYVIRLDTQRRLLSTGTFWAACNPNIHFPNVEEKQANSLQIYVNDQDFTGAPPVLLHVKFHEQLLNTSTLDLIYVLDLFQKGLAVIQKVS
jgi:hypothetical protein